MKTHSCIRAWKIPWREEPGGLHGVAESDTTEQLHKKSAAPPREHCWREDGKAPPIAIRGGQLEGERRLGRGCVPGETSFPLRWVGADPGCRVEWMARAREIDPQSQSPHAPAQKTHARGHHHGSGQRVARQRKGEVNLQSSLGSVAGDSRVCEPA